MKRIVISVVLCCSIAMCAFVALAALPTDSTSLNSSNGITVTSANNISGAGVQVLNPLYYVSITTPPYGIGINDTSTTAAGNASDGSYDINPTPGAPYLMMGEIAGAATKWPSTTYPGSNVLSYDLPPLPYSGIYYISFSYTITVPSGSSLPVYFWIDDWAALGSAYSKGTSSGGTGSTSINANDNPFNDGNNSYANQSIRLMTTGENPVQVNASPYNGQLSTMVYLPKGTQIYFPRIWTVGTPTMDLYPGIFTTTYSASTNSGNFNVYLITAY